MQSSKWFQPNFPFRPDRSPFFYGWVVMLAGTLGILASIPGQTAGVSPFTEPLLNALEISRVQLATAYMIGTIAAGLLLPRSGQLYDSHGVRPVIVITLLSFGLSLLLMGYADRIYHAINRSETPTPWLAIVIVTISFFLIRVWGQGILTMTSRAMISKWFNRKRGTVSAISGSMTSVAFASAPITLYYLVNLWGWRETFIYLGISYLVFLMPLFWLIFRDNPEECGLQMDGINPDEPSSENNEKENEKAFSEFETYHEFEAREALKTFSFWIFTAALVLSGFNATAITFNAESLATELGMEVSVFYGIMIPMVAFNIAGSFILGWLSNKIQLRFILMFHFTMQGAAQIALLSLDSFTAKIFYIACSGGSWASFGILSNVAFPRFFGRKNLGKISGYSMSCMVIGSALGPFFYSLIQSLSGSYVTAIYAGAGMAFVFLIMSPWGINPQQKHAK